jgi:hypothetical protein
MDGNKMDGRFFQTYTGRQENFYISDTTFAHFGDGSCASSVGVAVNPVEVDYTPEVWLDQINWRPSVNRNQRIRLGDVSLADGRCEKSCDAVNYLRAHDVDGSTLECFWNDGSPDNFRGTIMYSDRNPAVTVEPKCKADPSTSSIVCRNYDPKTLSANIQPPCDGCLPQEFLVAHKYGVVGINGAVEGKRSYWTMGAFEEGCGCAKHKLGGSFPLEEGLEYDIDLPVNFDLQADDVEEPHPEWMTANSEFTLHSNDPDYCVVLRMWMREAKPVNIFMNSDSMDHRKLRQLGAERYGRHGEVIAGKTYPTVLDEAGTNVLDPQERRLHFTVCGDLSGAASYIIRVSEAVQVNMEIEMSMEEFFAEAPITVEAGGIGGGQWDITPHDASQVVIKDDRLYSRTVALEKMVTGMTLLLSIPRSKVKVVCVHEVGEPCIPDILNELLNGFNPTGGRDRRDDTTNSTLKRALRGTGNVQVEFDINPPHAANETGDAESYAENLAWLEDMVEQLHNITTDETFAATFSALTDIPATGVAVTKAFGLSATDPEVIAITGVIEGVTLGVTSVNEVTSSSTSTTTDTTTTSTTTVTTTSAGKVIEVYTIAPQAPSKTSTTETTTTETTTTGTTTTKVYYGVRLTLLYTGDSSIALTTSEQDELSEAVSAFVVNSTALDAADLRNVILSDRRRDRRRATIISMVATQVFEDNVDAESSVAVVAAVTAALSAGANVFEALGLEFVVGMATSVVVTPAEALAESLLTAQGDTSADDSITAAKNAELSDGAIVAIVMSLILVFAIVGVVVLFKATHTKNGGGKIGIANDAPSDGTRAVRLMTETRDSMFDIHDPHMNVVGAPQLPPQVASSKLSTAGIGPLGYKSGPLSPARLRPSDPSSSSIGAPPMERRQSNFRSRPPPVARGSVLPPLRSPSGIVDDAAAEPAPASIKDAKDEAFERGFAEAVRRMSTMVPQAVVDIRRTTTSDGEPTTTEVSESEEATESEDGAIPTPRVSGVVRMASATAHRSRLHSSHSKRANTLSLQMKLADKIHEHLVDGLITQHNTNRSSPTDLIAQETADC